MDCVEKPDVRLHVHMARCGVASRRKCEEYIVAGRVSVNGKKVLKVGTKVTEDDQVAVDGHQLKTWQSKVYIALHKPAGFLCSDKDPDNRPLVKSLLDVSVKERIFHVGRLDYLTSGLIFYTTDGVFAREMTHPSCRIEKEYIVTGKDAILQALLDRFKSGIIIDNVRYKAKKTWLINPMQAGIVLTEGKNRELRKVFQNFGVKIKKVHRVRIGPVILGGLEPGRFRYLKQKEVNALFRQTSGNTG